MTPQEAIQNLNQYCAIVQHECGCRINRTDCDSCYIWTAIKALEIADRVSQIEYMEMPTPKIIETDNGIKANTNILEAVEVITHNTLLAKIKGEEERIYAK